MNEAPHRTPPRSLAKAHDGECERIGQTKANFTSRMQKAVPSQQRCEHDVRRFFSNHVAIPACVFHTRTHTRIISPVRFFLGSYSFLLLFACLLSSFVVSLSPIYPSTHKPIHPPTPTPTYPRTPTHAPTHTHPHPDPTHPVRAARAAMSLHTRPPPFPNLDRARVQRLVRNTHTHTHTHTHTTNLPNHSTPLCA